MGRPLPNPDVLVMGDHPCAYLAAALLRQDKSVHVAHTMIPGETLPDRLVLVSPHLFELHKILSPLKRKLDLTPIYGLKFLGDDHETSGGHVAGSIAAYVGGLKQIHAALVESAKTAGVSFHRPRQIQIRRLDETGVELSLDELTLHTKLLVVAGELPAEQKQMLGMQPSWDAQVLRRFSFLRLKGNKWFAASGKTAMPMSLNLHEQLHWAWLMPGPGQVQLAVEQSIESAATLEPSRLLRHWIDVLVGHGLLKGNTSAIDTSAAVSLDLPLAGALSQEGVANRALLIGPAGGFYTACAEEIYPACWSAVCAAEVAAEALQQRHVQDALQAYRQRWGATLGDYLRGPQQNLRFLLPLVYKNPAMTARLTEAILLGKSVMR